MATAPDHDLGRTRTLRLLGGCSTSGLPLPLHVSYGLDAISALRYWTNGSFLCF